MPPVFSRGLLWALIPGTVLSCGPAGDSAARPDAIVPRWHGTVDLSIASDQLTSPSRIAVDRQGRVFVSNLGDRRVQVFDSAGRHLFDLGQPGNERERSGGVCCLAFDRNDELWVGNLASGRYDRYQVSDTAGRLTGRLTFQIPAYPPQDHGYVGFGAVTFDQDGRLIIPVPWRSAIARYHVDSAGTPIVVDSIVTPQSDDLVDRQIMKGDSIRILRRPYGATIQLAFAPGGGWAQSVTSRYLVRWVVDGDTARTRTIRRDLIGPALSARERAAAESTLAADAERVGLTGSAVPFSVPGAKPLLVALLFDEPGHLWVQMSVADGELNRADVYDTAGRRIAMADWPDGVDLRDGFIGDHFAYGVRQDSTGSPQVVRVRFR